MNAEELAANPRLSRWFVQNLNGDPTLPLADDSVDAAMICVSIQYLQRPVEVLGEVARVLRPGGPVVISFSNRCFWTKAVAVWRGSTTPATPASSSITSTMPGSPTSKPAASPEWIEDRAGPDVLPSSAAPLRVESGPCDKGTGEIGDGIGDVLPWATSAESRR